MTAERPFLEEQPVDLTSRLVGRQRELGAIFDMVDILNQHRDRSKKVFLTVSGPSDIGITGFLAMVAEKAQVQRVPVAAIDLDRYENALPVDLAKQVVEDVRTQLITSYFEKQSLEAERYLTKPITSATQEELRGMCETFLSRPCLVLCDSADSLSEEAGFWVKRAIGTELGEGLKQILVWGSHLREYSDRAFQLTSQICLGPLSLEETKKQVGGRLGEQVFPYSFGYPRANLALAEMIEARGEVSPNDLITEAKRIVYEFAFRGVSSDQKENFSALAALATPFSIPTIRQALGIDRMCDVIDLMEEQGEYFDWDPQMKTNDGYAGYVIVEPYGSILRQFAEISGRKSDS